MSETYSVPTVVKDLFKGMLTVILLGVCSFSILLIVVLIVFNNSGEMREQAEWCAEYMPDAKAGECPDKTGY